jgi:hypothetical protein
LRAFFCTVEAVFLSAPLRFPAAASMASRSSCSDSFAYQTSSVRISANWAIASRYALADSRLAACSSALVKPLLRAAMVKLAAMRFTSYSNGPGSVSSKSFRSKTSSRSGDAYTPKFDRCASPHN